MRGKEKVWVLWVLVQLTLSQEDGTDLRREVVPLSKILLSIRYFEEADTFLSKVHYFRPSSILLLLPTALLSP
jgi:hypothetical protein